MNQFNTLRATSWLVLIIGLLFAFFVGRLTGETNTSWLTIIFGSLAVIGGCLWMRTSIWLLVPICWGLTGRISVLPLPFSVRDLGVMLAVVMFGIFYALKMVRYRSVSGWLEIFVAANLGYVGIMYLRHPVGTEAMNSTMVGGRPYFDTLIGLMAFLILRLVIIPPKLARIFPFFILAGSLAVAALGAVTRVFPATVPIIAPLYNGITTGNYLVQEGYQVDYETDQRLTELSAPGFTIVQVLCSYLRPITLLLPAYPFRMLLLVTGVVGMLYSGFRNVLISAVIFFLVTSYYRGGGRDFMRALSLGFVALILLLALQLSIGLPRQAQRALSFIPLVPWDQQEKEDAQGSTKWRVDMWKMVWSDKRYLNDKIWGDGFGFSSYELSIMRAGDLGGQGIVGASAQENFMINGALHSGPLSSIRFAGIVGLFILISMSIYIAFRAPKIIAQARGTPFFPAALFVCIPMITSPLFFVFIFGAYDTAIPDTFFTAGLLRLLQNSLTEYQKVAPKVQPQVSAPEEALREPLMARRMRKLPAYQSR